MIVTAFDHSYCDDLLTPSDWILDVGCRGFKFTHHFSKLGYQTIGLDPGSDVVDPECENLHFIRAALVGVDPGQAQYVERPDGGGYANHLKKIRSPLRGSNLRTVDTYTLQTLMSRFGIERFGLVKLDCEGAEYEILDNWPGPIAKQISVEFHDFLGVNPCDPNCDDYYANLMSRLGQWYELVKHERSECGSEMHYLDSLFVLK